MDATMNMTKNDERAMVRTARSAAIAAGVTATVSLVGVLVGESVQGTDFMSSGWAPVLGWLTFGSSCLLVLGITGLLVGLGAQLGRGGRRALWGMQLAAAVAAGAAATLPLVVVGIVDRAPEIVEDPPVAVPATFILAWLALGVAGLLTAVALRRHKLVPVRLTTLMIVASVVTIVPLPSRHFLLAFAVAGILGACSRETDVVTAEVPAPARSVGR